MPLNLIIRICPLVHYFYNSNKCGQVDKYTKLNNKHRKYDIKILKFYYSMRPKNSPYKSSFIVPSVPNKKRFVKSVKKNIYFKDALEKSVEAMKLVEKSRTTKVGTIILGTILSGVNSLLNNSKENLPYAMKHNSVNLNPASSIDSTKVHIIRFSTGYPSTRSVLEAERQNGSSTIELTNSLSDSIDTTSRSFLSRSFGFNQKCIDFLSPRFYGVMRDYSRIFNTVRWNIPEHSVQVPYGLVKEEDNSIVIKLHLIKIIDDDLDFSSLYNKTFNQNTLKQDSGAIPLVYQISNADSTKNDFMRGTICFKEASLKMSASFQTQAKIAKTFTKKIGPGDTFDFRMVHLCGPLVSY